MYEAASQAGGGPCARSSQAAPTGSCARGRASRNEVRARGWHGRAARGARSGGLLWRTRVWRGGRQRRACKGRGSRDGVEWRSGAHACTYKDEPGAVVRSRARGNGGAKGETRRDEARQDTAAAAGRPADVHDYISDGCRGRRRRRGRGRAVLGMCVCMYLMYVCVCCRPTCHTAAPPPLDICSSAAASPGEPSSEPSSTPVSTPARPCHLMAIPEVQDGRRRMGTGCSKRSGAPAAPDRAGRLP